MTEIYRYTCLSNLNNRDVSYIENKVKCEIVPVATVTPQKNVDYFLKTNWPLSRRDLRIIKSKGLDLSLNQKPKSSNYAFIVSKMTERFCNNFICFLENLNSGILP